MTIGEKIERLLEEQQRTQRWLASEARVSPNSIFKILAGGDTSYRIALRIAVKLGEDATWLLDDNLGWEDRATHASSTDLSGVSDIELLRALETRIARGDARSAETLEALKKMPTSGKGSRSPAQKRALSDAWHLGDFDFDIFMRLLPLILKLDDRIIKIGSEIARIGVFFPVRPEFLGPLSKFFRAAKQLDDFFRAEEQFYQLFFPHPSAKAKRRPRS